jgi:adenylate cyclase
MAQEIERKFLVTGNFKEHAYKQTRIVQAYISSTPERSVRIRIKGEKSYITIKGKPNSTGVSRFEWEKEIPLNEAESLLNLCEPGMIEKTRYEIKSGLHNFEVDEFYGENEGLIVAELELKTEDEAFISPEWLGEEVTGDIRYYNSMLKKHPYKSW